MTAQIIDDFLSEQDYNSIFQCVMSCNFQWYRQDEIGLPFEDVNGVLFTHMFYKEDTINSIYYDTLAPLLQKLKIKKLLRVKANLYPINQKYVEHGMHIDFNFPHNGAVYYLNTNDGFTILQDGTKINSIRNRIALFDTSIPHRSTNCTDQRFRVNININYLS